MRIEVAVRSFENGKLRMLYVVQKQSPSKCTKGELTHECPAKDTQVQQQHGPYNYIFQFKQNRLVH